MGSTGTDPKQTPGCVNGCKEKGKGKDLYYAGTDEDDETEDAADHQEKEASEHQSEGTADDAWSVGSMHALTRESRTPHIDGATTNRFAVLAEPDNGGTANAATHASVIEWNTAMRSSNLGRSRKCTENTSLHALFFSVSPVFHSDTSPNA